MAVLVNKGVPIVVQCNECIELKEIKAELEIFREATALFLGKYLTCVDKILPEDLEYGLAKFQEDVEEKDISTSSDIQIIEDLCVTLGMREVPGISKIQNIKIFIKELSRYNVTLNEELAKADIEIRNLQLDLRIERTPRL